MTLLLSACQNPVVETEQEQGRVSVDSGSMKRDEASSDELRIIGSYHEDMVKSLAEMYGEKYGCQVSYVRMPTGDAEAKLIAEMENPTCDVWIGGTVDAHEILKEKGILVSCQTQGEKEIPPQYLDADGVWKTQYVEVLSIGINSERWENEFAVEGIEKPTTLEDLLNPVYKGEIIIPDPVTSGTGYTFIASVLSAMGEEEGWKYLEKLNAQVGQYTSNGYTAAEKTGLGEYLVCVNFLSDQLLVKSYGYPLDNCVYEGAGWTAVPVSLTSGGKNNPEARRFIEFCLTKEACDVLVSLGNVLAVRDDCIGETKLENLSLNRNFNAVNETEAKTDRIQRFVEMMP